LGDHWTGLTVFVEHPEVPLDNNTVERTQRGPVVGRKNYYGSGAVWSGRLAAMLFSLFQTLSLWGINPRLWLTAYLTACAEAGGKAPEDLPAFLPWHLGEEYQQRGSEDDGGQGANTSEGIPGAGQKVDQKTAGGGEPASEGRAHGWTNRKMGRFVDQTRQLTSVADGFVPLVVSGLFRRFREGERACSGLVRRAPLLDRRKVALPWARCPRKHPACRPKPWLTVPR